MAKDYQPRPGELCTCVALAEVEERYSPKTRCAEVGDTVMPVYVREEYYNGYYGVRAVRDGGLLLTVGRWVPATPEAEAVWRLGG